MTSILTVVATFHREGHLAYPALRSAVQAVRSAAAHGVPCQIVAVIDDGDERTRAEVVRFDQHLHAVFNVDYRDASLARGHAFARADTKYVAPLDGDDLFDADWLWKGVQFLERYGDERSVAHTALRMSFGQERHGRIQIGTDHPLFHPIHLISSWHYADDLIAPTELFRRLPQGPNDFARCLGAEDWLWTCESLLEGVRHLVVPETTYLYRRQHNHVSLGMLPGMTFAPTRLFEKATLEAIHRERPVPSLSATDRLESIVAPKQRLESVPGWLTHAIRRGCDLDLQVYDLQRKLGETNFETPDFFPGVGALYMHLLAQIRGGRELIVFACEHADEGTLGMVRDVVEANRGSRELDVLVLWLGWRTRHQPVSLPAIVGDVQARVADLGASPSYQRLWQPLRYDLILRFVLQTRPSLFVNLDSDFVDGLVASFGRALASGGTRLLRHLPEEKFVDARTTRCRLNLRSNANYASIVGLHDRGSACVVPQRAPASQDGLCVRPSLVDHRPQLTCVLTLGRRARDLETILRQHGAALAEATAHNLTCELIIVASRDTRVETVLASLRDYLPEHSLLFLEDFEEATARNTGIAAARGRLVAVFEGDALVSPGWLARAARRADEYGPDSIVHPAVMVTVGDGLRVFRSPDMGGDTDLRGLVTHESWPCVAMARPDVFARVPYRPARAGSGFGFPTWQWNCDVTAAGGRHITVSRTASYRGWSVDERTLLSHLGSRRAPTLAPSEFFAHPKWLSQPSSSAKSARRDWAESFAGVTMPIAKRMLESLARLRRLRSIATPADWSEDEYRRNHPDVARLLPNREYLTGYAHYCLLGRQWGFAPAWVEGAPSADHDLLPQWLDLELRAMANAVPHLHPRCTGTISRAEPPSLAFADAYRTCLLSLQRQRPTHIFINEAIRPGGAELSMLHHIEAVLSEPGNRVLLLTTHSKDDRWKHRLPSMCSHLPLDLTASALSFDEQGELLVRLLLNSGARVVHLFNSYLTWQALRRHAPALASRLALFVSIFSIPPVEGVADPGYARHLQRLRPWLAGVFTDNTVAARRLTELCGVEAGCVVVVRHPVAARARFDRPGEDCRRVLWAGRIDADKRPDLLAEIALRMPDWTFDVHGDRVLDDGRELARLRKLPNVRCRGPFSSFDQIPTGDYRAFLYTSAWDGLPNVLLEAMSAGLLVVAPDVGGVSDIVGKDTGVLVGDADNPEAYVAALREGLCRRDEHARLAKAGQARVAADFSTAGFRAILAAYPGYLRPAARSEPSSSTCLHATVSQDKHSRANERHATPKDARLSGVASNWTTAWRSEVRSRGGTSTPRPSARYSRKQP